MSQDTFPFVATDDAGHYDEADAANKKKLAIVGGLIALALGAAAFLFLGGGDSGEGDVFIPRAPRAAKAVVAPPAAKKAVAKKLPVAYGDQIGRNPFQALYVVSAAAPASTSSTTATTAVPASTSSTSSTSSTTSSTSASQSVTPAAPTTTRYALKLVSIGTSPEARSTTWTVDGTRTTVLPAQKFGKYGELVVLAFSKNAQGAVDKAILQVGDDSPMEVAVGQTNSVL